jgi:hypothetical protein
MKIAAIIFLVIAILSLISGVGYLAVGLLSESSSQNLLSPWPGVAQIVIATYLLLFSLLFLKNNEKYKNYFVSGIFMYEMN